MEARIARLESDVAHLRTDVADIKVDVRSLRDKVDAMTERFDLKFDALRDELRRGITETKDRIGAATNRAFVSTSPSPPRCSEPWRVGSAGSDADELCR